MAERVESFVAECYWPDVREEDVRALDQRVAAALDDDVRYLGSVLMRADEVVLCFFAGSEASVRRAAEQASIPFERILEAARSPWPKVVNP